MTASFYHYLRALELEGRHPQDAGAWPITVRRLAVGEGLPSDSSSWAQVNVPDGASLPPAPQLPPTALSANRVFYYRRIRSSAECERHMRSCPESPVLLAFRLTAGWASPPQGVIPLPAEAGPPIPLSHAISFFGLLPDRRLFRFASSWGEHGRGYMPYEYFDRYVLECWASYRRPDDLRLFRFKKLDAEGRARWSAHDEDDHHIYGFEVRDDRHDDRRAWAFVVEREGALEIEELYVRREWRRHGHGRWLADRVAQLAREKGMPLRLWVAFADCKTENEGNWPALLATARRIGVRFRPCSVPWAAYFGTNELPGEEAPVEPTVPERPRSTRPAVLTAARVLGQPATNGQATSGSCRHAQERAIAVGTPEWDELTERRAELIHKKNRQGLTDAERDEYEQLQRLSRAAIGRAFPPPTLESGDLATAEQAIGVIEDTVGS